MLPTEAMTRIAAYAATAAGVRAAHYPAPGRIDKMPALVLLWGETTIDYQSTEQYWDMQVRGLLLTGLATDTPQQVGAVDPLIARIVDQFSAAANYAGFVLSGTDGDRVDQCLVRTVTPASLVEYAGQSYYGATLTWSVLMRRFGDE